MGEETQNPAGRRERAQEVAAAHQAGGRDVRAAVPRAAGQRGGGNVRGGERGRDDCRGEQEEEDRLSQEQEGDRLQEEKGWLFEWLEKKNWLNKFFLSTSQFFSYFNYIFGIKIRKKYFLVKHK